VLPDLVAARLWGEHKKEAPAGCGGACV
jgi:hypothetical protein